MKRLLPAILAPALLGAPAFADDPHPLLQEGAELYSEFCSQCHGPKLVHPGGPAFDLRHYPTDKAEDFKRVVFAGKGDMPAWAEVLAGEEVDRVWVYVATRAGQETFPEGADVAFGPADKYLPKESTGGGQTAWEGDPKDHPLFAEGRTLYNEMCSHCHGIDMVNSGAGSYDLRKYPADRPNEFKKTIQDGKGSMPAWGDVLFPKEIDAIWVFVSTRGGKDKFLGGADDAEPHSTAPTPTDLVENGTLRVCLARNGGAMSGWRSSGGTGFDYGVVKEVAARLDLELEINWFETEQDEFQEPVNEAYAMLALDRCDLVPAHPLMPGTTGAPPVARAAPPRFDVKQAQYPHQHADLRPAEATVPYMRTQLALVVAPGIDPSRVRSLADLSGLKVGVEQGTLAEGILRRHAPADAMAAATTFNPGPKFLWEMEVGKFEVALVDVAAFDFHMRQNMISKLQITDYRHPFSVNIGMLALADRPGLIKTVSGVITAMIRDGTIAAIAEREKVHWAAPREASSTVAAILAPPE